MRIDPAGWPFIAGSLLFGILAEWFIGAGGAAIFLVLTCFFLFFFRDPDRPITGEAHAVLSPADGRVMIAGAPAGQACPPGNWQQISIFLSPMDVHVNRVPASGRVTRVVLTRGRFLPAYRREAATVNERSEIWIDHQGQAIVARQIVGILARRVVCRLNEGVTVRAGDHLGIMKFGSRMDVFVPADAVIAVKIGDKVRGGETVIAVLHSK